MAIIDIFSKRQARLRGKTPDVYRYDDVPEPLRVQLVHLVRDLLEGGREENLHFNQEVQAAYEHITNWLCREYGLFRLTGKSYEERNPPNELLNFILGAENHEHVLDAVELVVRYAD